MDAAEYKHIVLGLIFLKYISDAFEEQRDRWREAFADPDSDYDFEDPEDREAELEERDYYTMHNVFWVPDAARWETIVGQAKQPDIMVRIYDALEAIADENPHLRGIVD